MRHTKRIIDYLYKFEKRLICPIGEYEKDFDFLCLGDVAFARALGFETFNVRNTLEKVVEGQILTEDDLVQVKEKKYFDYSYFDRELKQLKDAKKNNDKLFGGGCFGPLTIASDIIGIAECTKMCIKNPKLLKGIVKYINNYIIELAKKEESEGADFFWIAEPVASLFSPNAFEMFSGNFINEIYSNISIPGFLHVCGKTLKHTDKLVKTGAQVLSIDYVVDIRKTIRVVPEDIVIMGNVNPIMLLSGTKEEIAKEVNELNKDLRNYKNFILSSGCLIPQGTPSENVELMIKLTKDFKLKTNRQLREIRNIINMVLDKKEFEVINYINANKIEENLICEAIEEIEKIANYLKLENKVLDYIFELNNKILNLIKEKN
ncbi:methylcobamide--CoM methyltransferase [Clostridium botulinum]|uniref:Methylcobamide--CoM methyltransferase n=1 Tax=Clostridium botulinum TaxID=1491 RepID=A0A846JDH4_CLOBO|nr:methylcobamide--CoM methyltransferase [Clostridium botulinum]ACA56306.1 putative methylcobamide:CoM methyltransferase [Clostridium botulinum A3 str. Loch Maree]NFH64440.1 methylcobamide--CoM methyltransferase [Clostridium botulinum]NFJ08174.1 methylcobamide--CoM methyltransferase [Clostridium botulinum]NFK15940.1 methylcobamide--CoM methyltransferase [Clostridium botulinum]NFM93162.1 methylcobamide--CoM methyltransferase [Clostridium botulinum]